METINWATVYTTGPLTYNRLILNLHDSLPCKADLGWEAQHWATALPAITIRVSESEYHILVGWVKRRHALFAAGRAPDLDALEVDIEAQAHMLLARWLAAGRAGDHGLNPAYSPRDACARSGKIRAIRVPAEAIHGSVKKVERVVAHLPDHNQATRLIL